MAKPVTWAIPGDLDTATGGYAYDRRIIAELRRLGWTLDVLGLGDGFPRPTEAQKAEAEGRLRASPSTMPIVVDGLAFGALPEVAAELQRARPVVALVHHPLALETGLTAVQSQTLLASERAALAAAHRVVTTSPWTADLLVERFGVTGDRLTVILPGTDRRPLARGSGGPVHLLSVGAIVPRKGFDLLVEALARLAELPWRLTIVGDRERDPVAAAQVDALIAHHRLDGRIDVLGKVSPGHLSALYDSADAFVLASQFEGYGMAFAEALAHGLPVIGTTGGATRQTVPATAGRLVAPGDVTALAEALCKLVEDHSHRRTLAVGARAAATSLPSWGEAGEKFSDLLTMLI